MVNVGRLFQKHGSYGRLGSRLLMLPSSSPMMRHGWPYLVWQMAFPKWPWDQWTFRCDFWWSFRSWEGLDGGKQCCFLFNKMNEQMRKTQRTKLVYRCELPACTTSSDINCPTYPKLRLGTPKERVVKKVSEKKGWARGTKHMLSGWKESSLRKTPQTYHCFQWRIYIG